MLYRIHLSEVNIYTNKEKQTKIQNTLIAQIRLKGTSTKISAKKLPYKVTEITCKHTESYIFI